MSWFNYYGLAAMAIIMIPNLIYAFKHRGDEAGALCNRALVILEQIGRYGCFFFMIFNIPYTYFNFWFEHALAVYLAVNGGLCAAYLVFWGVCWNRNGKLKALSLSILPSCIFLFSGIALLNLPLIACAGIFAVCHIWISYQNATAQPLTVRAYKSTDCASLSRLFYETVHSVNATDYTAEQLSAWARDERQLTERAQDLLSQNTLVAERGGEPVGFASMKETGELDLLFVRQDCLRHGIATRLCDELERSFPVIQTFASITAKPFFEKRGYVVIREQTVERNGVRLKNYEMQKRR